MFSHVTVGISDLDRGLAFYRPLMAALGLKEKFREPDVPGQQWAGFVGNEGEAAARLPVSAGSCGGIDDSTSEPAVWRAGTHKPNSLPNQAFTALPSPHCIRCPSTGNAGGAAGPAAVVRCPAPGRGG